ncbi:Rv3235 family protein [Micromonospora sp. NBC_01796]|uniref:Rv3235 family protein n=1 Tax=Micromonospora sp. NBC_01796 TaxID=2975987 RepID=UPI002DDC5B42|nr:Rv3235 family protein [Micromonospora sp. NBC_01796]WSA87517.1 Rv3235 family protein [Micromonospora sp. NBC_01796]
MPPLDPPFDDELAGPGWVAGLDGQLALPLSVPVPRVGGSGATDRAPATPVAPAALPPEALATASAEARQAAYRFLSTALEILNGYRPAAHVRPLSVGADATAITEQLVAATRRLGEHRRQRPAVRPPGAGAGHVAVRLRLLRVSEPHQGIAEAAAVLGSDERSWAMAYRLERRRGSWLGTYTRVL